MLAHAVGGTATVAMIVPAHATVVVVARLRAAAAPSPERGGRRRAAVPAVPAVPATLAVGRAICDVVVGCGIDKINV